MTAPDSATDPPPDPPPPWGVALIVVGGSVIVAAILWGIGSLPKRTATAVRSGSTPTTGLAYVGSRSCGACHPGEAAAHSRSGHARTLRLAATIPIARRLDGKEFADPE